VLSIAIRPARGQLTVVAGADGVSLTANATGFTPLGEVVGTYGWSPDQITKAADQCNKRGEVCIVGQLHPQAFLVPRTRGKSRSDFLIGDLLKAVEHQGIRTLHFTHYFFLLDELPEQEIRIILEHLRSRSSTLTSLRELVFDIDHKHESGLRMLYESVFL
jgi:hypothetical protein